MSLSLCVWLGHLYVFVIDILSFSCASSASDLLITGRKLIGIIMMVMMNLEF